MLYQIACKLRGVYRFALYLVRPTDTWHYDESKAGYIGGINLRNGRALAFIDEQGNRFFSW